LYIQSARRLPVKPIRCSSFALLSPFPFDDSDEVFSSSVRKNPINKPKGKANTLNLEVAI
jgi:hypothetical protein